MNFAKYMNIASDLKHKDEYTEDAYTLGYVDAVITIIVVAAVVYLIVRWAS